MRAVEHGRAALRAVFAQGGHGMSSASNVWLSLTHRERDALLALDACRAAWRTFDGRTWSGLAQKGLVGFGVAPGLTPADRAGRAG